ncbi:hypothetical protein [Candidatus Magnetominusculus xianensis]|uniref:Uncharacterized protein n=1 Tax=Candidatus Magnetominusculus xianensis TaxID=1748249 RepID=A0ABR5SG70_9BACT|nr:hypothetical protein [Candidatus Magnetominusculus xianensis]KWT87647.1 hypothetical protein ASN18_1324 [Candidatus Magnetominusculus xianensis]MBF0405665.1 hypothetical protein [Nitrospirota bacterium]
MSNLENAINKIWDMYYPFFQRKILSEVANDRTYISNIKNHLKTRNSVRYSDNDIFCAWQSFIKNKNMESKKEEL